MCQRDEAIETTDDKELQKKKKTSTTTTKEKQTKVERSKGNRSYSKNVKGKLFCCAFKFFPVFKVFFS